MPHNELCNPSFLNEFICLLLELEVLFVPTQERGALPVAPPGQRGLVQSDLSSLIDPRTSRFVHGWAHDVAV